MVRIGGRRALRVCQHPVATCVVRNLRRPGGGLVAASGVDAVPAEPRPSLRGHTALAALLSGHGQDPVRPDAIPHARLSQTSRPSPMARQRCWQQPRRSWLESGSTRIGVLPRAVFSLAGGLSQPARVLMRGLLHTCTLRPDRSMVGDVAEAKPRRKSHLRRLAGAVTACSDAAGTLYIFRLS